MAVKLPHLSIIIEELLKKGAEIDPKDDRGKTPLIIAMTNDNVTAASILLKCGAKSTEISPSAKVNVKTKSDWSEANGKSISKNSQLKEKNSAIAQAKLRKASKETNSLTHRGPAIKENGIEEEKTSVELTPASEPSTSQTDSLLT